ncbi:MAG: sensor histidine kinase [Candidatus Omnitrophica bacterium]|nr:sensor histidine kinase [Candidatus Omnitrophota bacterium]MBU4590360.1 sensor histidine kinase [Candidatus Omnitrophota bacterium]
MKSIRSKLIFWVAVLFIFIGLSIYLPLSIILPEKITSQVIKRDVDIAKFLSNETKSLLLLDDKIALSILLHDNLDRLEDVQYLFVRGPEEKIISHTFNKGFPKGLLSFNPGSYPHSVKGFLSNNRRLYDIAIPILEGELGTLHMGISLESGKKDIAEIAKINYYVAIVILIGLGIGIVVFLIIGILFSNQIIRLKNFASRIGGGDLEAKIDIKSKDEIGELTTAFNEMVGHLKENIQEIKRLNTVEERNRIALDLHDGCAQDLANIIKRIELSERLYKIDPAKAIEELALLRESTKDLLNRTRQVIFDLKSPEETDFNIVDNLNSYLIEYKKSNNIDVNLNISGSIDGIVNKKSVFYIIREALANVKKHSMARKVDLSLVANNGSNLKIFIKDDGKGFNVNRTELSGSSSGKWGLAGMRQRASSLGGTFVIESVPEQGTMVSIDIPLKERS